MTMMRSKETKNENGVENHSQLHTNVIDGTRAVKDNFVGSSCLSTGPTLHGAIDSYTLPNVYGTGIRDNCSTTLQLIGDGKEHTIRTDGRASIGSCLGVLIGENILTTPDSSSVVASISSKICEDASSKRIQNLSFYNTASFSSNPYIIPDVYNARQLVEGTFDAHSNESAGRHLATARPALIATRKIDSHNLMDQRTIQPTADSIWKENVVPFNVGHLSDEENCARNQKEGVTAIMTHQPPSIEDRTFSSRPTWSGINLRQQDPEDVGTLWIGDQQGQFENNGPPSFTSSIGSHQPIALISKDDGSLEIPISVFSTTGNTDIVEAIKRGASMAGNAEHSVSACKSLDGGSTITSNFYAPFLQCQTEKTESAEALEDKTFPDNTTQETRRVRPHMWFLITVLLLLVLILAAIVGAVVCSLDHCPVNLSKIVDQSSSNDDFARNATMEPSLAGQVTTVTPSASMSPSKLPLEISQSSSPDSSADENPPTVRPDANTPGDRSQATFAPVPIRTEIRTPTMESFLPVRGAPVASPTNEQTDEIASEESKETEHPSAPDRTQSQSPTQPPIDKPDIRPSATIPRGPPVARPSSNTRPRTPPPTAASDESSTNSPTPTSSITSDFEDKSDDDLITTKNPVATPFSNPRTSTPLAIDLDNEDDGRENEDEAEVKQPSESSIPVKFEDNSDDALMATDSLTSLPISDLQENAPVADNSFDEYETTPPSQQSSVPAQVEGSDEAPVVPDSATLSPILWN